VFLKKNPEILADEMVRDKLTEVGLITKAKLKPSPPS